MHNAYNVQTGQNKFLLLDTNSEMSYKMGNYDRLLTYSAIEKKMDSPF